MARVHQPPEPRFDFKSHDVGVENRSSGRAVRFARRQHGRDQRRARVGERDEAHVVVVERVRGGTVGQCRVGSGGAQTGADDDTTFGVAGANHLRQGYGGPPKPWAKAEDPASMKLKRGLNDACHRFDGAGQRDADRIEQGGRGARTSGGGRLRGGDKLRERRQRRLRSRDGHAAPPDVTASGWPIADMKRCLMNT
jgi:hypothetical protein